MNVARILYPVKVLGPGNRIGIWLCGCHRACKGCSNPELWYTQSQYEIPVERVVELIQTISEKHPVDGFTISGGEPFEQSSDLAYLIQRIQSISDDILVYTGYDLAELRARKDRYIDMILQRVAVIIDGPYIEALNETSPLKGSTNQSIHILQKHYVEAYTDYLNCCNNQIQNFSTTDGIVSVGIHHRGFTRPNS